ncbi:flavodoxin family protein [Thermococcus sp. ES12]|uniref:flavodoxin family protein n=1 Tax=Thermococcus sp. ES12 TaxID=1638246 RepID=UPI0014308B46|nr:flavodoxin family protein [Thermococcus sp. ES12]NJE76368.1 flavodoxin family protein [Thermococcus sp. ES12]
MKVCIIYDSERGSTEKVARVMADAIGGRVEVKVLRATENPDIEDCSLVIVGAPIYYERPLPSVKNFILSKDGLKGKNVAVFILCIADKFGRLGKAYTERRYMRLIAEPIKGRIIARKVFDGWILKENPETLREAQEWIKRVLEAYERENVLEEIEHPGGGENEG